MKLWLFLGHTLWRSSWQRCHVTCVGSSGRFAELNTKFGASEGEGRAAGRTGELLDNINWTGWRTWVRELRGNITEPNYHISGVLFTQGTHLPNWELHKQMDSVGNQPGLCKSLCGCTLDVGPGWTVHVLWHNELVQVKPFTIITHTQDHPRIYNILTQHGKYYKCFY